MDSDFLDTTHTEKNYYRWNEAGVPALYLADSLESALAECGKYHICDRAEGTNQSIKSISGRPPNEWIEEKFQPLAAVEVVVARIQLPSNLAHLDFTNDPPATHHFSNAGFKDLTMDQIKQNSYYSIPGDATMKIGAHYYKQKAHMIRVPSARIAGSHCCVLFPDNFSPERATVLDKQEVTLYALDSRGNRITGKKIVSLDENTFGYELNGLTNSLTPLKLK